MWWLEWLRPGPRHWFGKRPTVAKQIVRDLSAPREGIGVTVVVSGGDCIERIGVHEELIRRELRAWLFDLAERAIGLGAIVTKQEEPAPMFFFDWPQSYAGVIYLDDGDVPRAGAGRIGSTDLGRTKTALTRMSDRIKEMEDEKRTNTE